MLDFISLSNNASRKAREHLAATVFSNIQEAVSITDRDGNILAVTPAFTRILEYSEAEIVGKSPRF